MEGIVHPATTDLHSYTYIELCGEIPTVVAHCAQADITCLQDFTVNTYQGHVGAQTQAARQYAHWSEKPWNPRSMVLAEDEWFWCGELKDTAVAWQMRPKLAQHAAARLPAGQQRQDV